MRFPIRLNLKTPPLFIGRQNQLRRFQIGSKRTRMLDLQFHFFLFILRSALCKLSSFTFLSFPGIFVKRRQSKPVPEPKGSIPFGRLHHSQCVWNEHVQWESQFASGYTQPPTPVSEQLTLRLLFSTWLKAERLKSVAIMVVDATNRTQHSSLLKHHTD